MTNALKRLTKRGPATDTVVIAADPDEAPALTEAVEALKRARRLAEAAGPDEMVRAEERLERAEAELAALREATVTVTFSLEGIGPTAVEALVAEHPPTPKQVKDALKAAGGNPKGRPQWNEDTFPQALLAATVRRIEFSDDPDGATEGLSEDDARDLWASKMSVADRSRLFVTALSLDQRGSTLEDLGKG